MPGVTGWTLLQHRGLAWERDGDPPAAVLTLSIIPNSEEHFTAGKKASNNKERQQHWKKGTKELQNIQKIINKMTIVGPYLSIIIINVN